MKLSAYLKEENERAIHFAQRAGVSRSCISLLLSGKRLPSTQFALRIESITAGKVTHRDWTKKKGPMVVDSIDPTR